MSDKYYYRIAASNMEKFTNFIAEEKDKEDEAEFSVLINKVCESVNDLCVSEPCRVLFVL